MSGKRKPTTDLNHDNWDREEEAEERGNFPVAPEDELKTRVIKKAVRKVTPVDGGSAKQSAFSGFSGFGNATAAPSGGPSPFSFLSNMPVSSAASSGGGSSATSLSTFSFASTNKPAAQKPADPTDRSSSYYAKVTSLNQCVSEWIKTHVDKNPFCDLQTIFKEYKSYMADIEKEEADNRTNVCNTLKSDKELSTPGIFKFVPTSNAPAASTSFSFTSTPGAVSAASDVQKTNGFSFSANTDTKTAEKPATCPVFSFGTPKAAPSTSGGFSFGAAKSDYKSSVPDTSASLTFGATKSEEKPSTGFSFGAAKPDVQATSSFSFGKPNATTPDKNTSFGLQTGPPKFFGITPQPAPAAEPTSNENDGDDEDQPPKVEFKQVVEEDATYSKKCKIFVKKDDNYTDRGLGTLYLKPVKGTEKTQLIVRADTSLGNVIINMVLVAGIPVKRMGKNNVLIIGMPTPEEKSTSILIRVKTAEEADELLKTIENYQSK